MKQVKVLQQSHRLLSFQEGKEEIIASREDQGAGFSDPESVDMRDKLRKIMKKTSKNSLTVKKPLQ